MERFGGTFLIAGVVTFLLGFFLQGVMPIITLRNMKIASVEEVAGTVIPEFAQLAADYPEEFRKYFGEVSSASQVRALELGKSVYGSEACWHCHSQFVRPVSKEDLRFGRVSRADEYQNMMNLPHLFGTRRIGPDLSRQSGVHSNDWHVAHFYDPRSVSPYSVMPAYPWFFDEERRPNERGLAIVAYMQWLGSWIDDELPATIYDVATTQGGTDGPAQ